MFDETPHVCFAYFDTGSTPVFFGLSNLPDGESDHGLRIDGTGTGYVVHCEGGGYFKCSRGDGSAHDKKGKVIRRFQGDAGAGHARNFVDAVFAHDRTKLNSEVQIGHQSTAWCNLADVAHRVGGAYDHDAAIAACQKSAPWTTLAEQIETHLAKHGVDPQESAFRLGPVLGFDSKRQQFIGDHADAANGFLRREYRKGFEVPKVA